MPYHSWSFLAIYSPEHDDYPFLRMTKIARDFPYRRFAAGALEFIPPSPIADVTATFELVHVQYYGENKFTQLDIRAMRVLIPYLYCQPCQWQEVKVPEIKTLWAMVLSVVRLYPLTARGKLL